LISLVRKKNELFLINVDSDISVCKEFNELNLKETRPNMKVIIGGTFVERKKKKPKMDPMTMLKTYMEQQNLR